MEQQITQRLEQSEQYTLAVAEAMPEKEYGFRPTKDVWSFGELMHHIAYGIRWWEANYIRKTETPWDPPPAKKGKKVLMEELRKAYADLRQTVGSTKDPAGFYSTLDHITHHRGQATVQLRLKGIVPPEYVY